MNGKEVYKFACSRVPEVLESALGNAGMGADEVDWLLLHQANIRIIEAVASRLGIPLDKVPRAAAARRRHGSTAAHSRSRANARTARAALAQVIANLDEYGNTSAASIPLALDEAVKSGKVKPGDVIACAGFGAGLSWGAAILRWG